jgi:peptide/nickel transport system substrate-binding protein
MGNRSGIGNLPYQNVGTPLASSPKLRQAFEEAIDRSTLNRVVFGGLYQPVCTEIPPSNTVWYAATKIPCTPYDPADAKKLVAQSGFANPTVRLLVSTSSDDQRLAQFLQAEEATVGINVVIDTADSGAVTARKTAGSFDTGFGGNMPGNVDPNGNIAVYVSTSGVRNFGGYSSPRMDLICANGLKATETTARSTLYRVAQQIVATDRPIIPLYNITTYTAYGSSLTGFAFTDSGGLVVANARYR